MKESLDFSGQQTLNLSEGNKQLLGSGALNIGGRNDGNVNNFTFNIPIQVNLYQ